MFSRTTTELLIIRENASAKPPRIMESIELPPTERTAKVISTDNGIEKNTWTNKVDDVRASIDAGVPANLGINWYESFFDPLVKPRADRKAGQSQGRDYWVGLEGTNWGEIAGGHDITVVAASDLRQAFGLCNTWGLQYPFIVWLPYSAYERLMSEDGETGIPVDRK